MLFTIYYRLVMSTIGNINKNIIEQYIKDQMKNSSEAKQLQTM